MLGTGADPRGQKNTEGRCVAPTPNLFLLLPSGTASAQRNHETNWVVCVASVSLQALWDPVEELRLAQSHSSFKSFLTDRTLCNLFGQDYFHSCSPA